MMQQLWKPMQSVQQLFPPEVKVAHNCIKNKFQNFQEDQDNKEKLV